MEGLLRPVNGDHVYMQDICMSTLKKNKRMSHSKIPRMLGSLPKLLKRKRKRWRKRKAFVNLMSVEIKKRTPFVPTHTYVISISIVSSDLPRSDHILWFSLDKHAVHFQSCNTTGKVIEFGQDLGKKFLAISCGCDVIDYYFRHQKLFKYSVDNSTGRGLLRRPSVGSS